MAEFNPYQTRHTDLIPPFDDADWGWPERRRRQEIEQEWERTSRLVQIAVKHTYNTVLWSHADAAKGLYDWEYLPTWVKVAMAREWAWILEEAGKRIITATAQATGVRA